MPRIYRQSSLAINKGRKQSSPLNLRNIYRFQSGWYLHKNFRNIPYRAYFSADKYGDMEKAKQAAILERDWLDHYRKRIIDRVTLQLVGLKKVRGKDGKYRIERVLGVRLQQRAINIKAIILAVLREVKEEETRFTKERRID